MSLLTISHTIRWQTRIKGGVKMKKKAKKGKLHTGPKGGKYRMRKGRKAYGK